MATNLVAQFADLFEGRRDAYGTEEGGCWRVDPVFCGWPTTAAAHLNGDRPIGVYPMVLRPHHGLTRDLKWQVKWGCVDVDLRTPSKPSGDYDTEAEAHAAVVNLQRALEHVGITSWVEITRSGGRHLWVFAETWVPATTMRHALLVACQVAGCPSREVNPKQTTLGEGQLGNYVRTMYPACLAGGTDGGGRVVPSRDEPERQHSHHHLSRNDRPRHSGAGYECGRCGNWAVRPPAPHAEQQADIHMERVEATGRGSLNDDAISAHGGTATTAHSGMPRRVAFLQDGRPLCVSCFTTLAHANRVTPKTLQAIADKWVPPAPSVRLVIEDFAPAEYKTQVLARKINAEGYVVWRDGPEDGDRSRGMSYIAYQARRSGLTPDEAFVLLKTCPWQKFAGRADEDLRIREMIVGAWQ